MYFLRSKKVGTLDWARLFPADASSTFGRHEQCLNFGANVNVNDFQESMSIPNVNVDQLSLTIVNVNDNVNVLIFLNVNVLRFVNDY